MAASSSHLSYDDLRHACDRALASDKGIRIYEESFGRLVNLRQRFFKLRSIERKRSREMYPKDDPRHNTCAYDIFSIALSEKANELADKCPKGELFLDVLKRQAGGLKVEDLK